MDVREKLVELLMEFPLAYDVCDKQEKKECGDTPCCECLANHLIANGVTVQDNTEISDEFLEQLRKTPVMVMTEEPTIEVVQEWISVKDRLPDNKEHDWVLAQVVEDNGFMHIPKVMEYRQQKNDWFEETYGWLSEHNGAFTVTHWMPLPPAPEDMK